MLRSLRPPTARFAVSAVGALVVSLGLSGCQTGGDPGAGAVGTEQEPVVEPVTPSVTDAATTPVVEAPVYVAMGDSYTAAPLFPLRDEEVIDDCLRSTTNYPRLVADRLDLDLTDVSCSGASTVSMFNPQRFGTGSQPPQLDALHPDVDVVSLGIGANDFRFFSQMMFDCLDVAELDVEGSPCRERNAADGSDEELDSNLVTIRKNVNRVVREIAARAPEARIVLVGYPQLLPSEGTCRPRLPLAEGDYAYALELNLALADAVRRGGVAGGAEYIDMVAASQGHDICADRPWVAGIRGKAEFAMGLHPYPTEQKAVADLLAARLA